jgi:pantoate--beta-alanine ligase
MSALVVSTPLALAAEVPAGAAVGLVPTMGALHEGHLTLIRQAAAENDVVVVSIFVNPTQFTDPSDLAKYPRDLRRDVDLAGAAGATLVYAPEVGTIYPHGFATAIHVDGVTELWEGESRPGHFDGVATVVTILLNQVRPDRSYFGEKDFQQLAMVTRLHRDLHLTGAIVPVPTVREVDGLAMSSRNVRLSARGRAIAPAIYDTLVTMQRAVAEGERSAMRLVIAGAVLLKRFPEIDLDYLQVVDPSTLEPLDTVEPAARAIVAVTIDGVRLIDNLKLTPGDDPR